MSNAEAYYEAQKDMMEKDINKMKEATKSVSDKFTEINKIRDELPVNVDGISSALAAANFTEFGNTLVKEIEQEEFERWKRKEQNAVYGLDTGEGKDQSVNYYQVINDNPNLTKSSANHGNYGTPNYTTSGRDSAWTTVKITTPAFNDVSDNINKILEDNYIMDRLSKACIRDDQALYVRELLNRIDRCCRWLEANTCCEFSVDVPIAILKNDIYYIKNEYDLDYRKDGDEILAEILEGNNKPIRKMYSTQLLDEYYIIKENWNALRNRVEEHKKHEGLPGMDEAFDMVIEDMNELEMRGER